MPCTASASVCTNGSLGSKELVAAYDRCVAALVAFRKLHFELAYTYVRQWDARKDDEIQGTGGTPFMPYLRKHRRTTFETLIERAGKTDDDRVSAAS